METYYQRNREHCLENARKLRAADPEAKHKQRAYNQRYYQEGKTGAYKNTKHPVGKRNLSVPTHLRRAPANPPAGSPAPPPPPPPPVAGQLVGLDPAGRPAEYTISFSITEW